MKYVLQGTKRSIHMTMSQLLSLKSRRKKKRLYEAIEAKYCVEGEVKTCSKDPWLITMHHNKAICSATSQLFFSALHCLAKKNSEGKLLPKVVFKVISSVKNQIRPFCSCQVNEIQYAF